MLLCPLAELREYIKTGRNTAEGRPDRDVQGDITIYEEVVEAGCLDCTDGSVCYM